MHKAKHKVKWEDEALENLSKLDLPPLFLPLFPRLSIISDK
jgi:hypothetical protein